MTRLESAGCEVSGGSARAARALSPRRRREIAQKAARARWSSAKTRPKKR